MIILFIIIKFFWSVHMSSYQITVGVDIAKRKFDAVRLENGKYKHKTFDNSADGFATLITWLLTFGEIKPLICMEATGAYSIPLAEFLVNSGHSVSVVNPAKIKAFAKSELSRLKTDKADAKLIARYALEKQPALWTPPPPNMIELQALLRRIEHLLEIRQMEQNRLDTANPVIIESIKTLLTLLDEQLESTRKQIRQLIDQDPVLKHRAKLLESIPGVGSASIAHLLLALSEHHGFTHAKQAAAYAGLEPRISESGDWTGKTRLSKTGDALLRKALYMPALVAWRHNPAIHVFCERLKTNGKNGKAIACAAMRKLVHIAFAILKSNKPFDPLYKTKLALA
jgi:transposase